MVEEREKEICYYVHKLFPFAPEDFKKELSTKSLFVMLNELLSKRVDKRLIKYLYEKSLKGKILRLTHEDIAKDIGTVREVVSRLLKNLERDEIIQLGRGEIIIKDMERLKKELNFLRLYHNALVFG